MKYYTTTCKYIDKECLNNSYYGGPRFYGSFEATEDGRTITGKTANNSPVGYVIQNCKAGKLYDVMYHITAAGNTIIDRIKEAQNNDR